MSRESEDVLRSLPTESRFYPSYRYSSQVAAADSSPDSFWSSQARKLEWFRNWDKVLEWEEPYARWFVGGTINASFNALDRHIHTSRRNKVAYIWEGENGEVRSLTFQDLFREVNKFANLLIAQGIVRGDRIAIYMPMVPEFIIAILAATRIGATFSVIFSGFSAMALAGRLNDSKTKLVVTADVGHRRGKVLKLKEIVDEAVTSAPSVERIVVYRREGKDVDMKEGRDIWWQDSIKDVKTYLAPEHLDSTHPLFILYTSGTTGKPKGAVHGTGGYLTYAYATQKWVFDGRDDDVYWCTADIGWITGHTYVIFGPLLHGLTSVIFEGTPDYPTPEKWWEIIERHKVSIFYTTPTAIRSLMRHGNDLPNKHDLGSLRLLGTVGEPINPAAWEWYYGIIGGTRCPIVDTFWQTETGGILISPSPNLGLVPLKPGSATLPLPGIEADIVDENGSSVPLGVRGFLVIKRPWPGMFVNLYEDPERYKEVYWTKFPGSYYTGDYAVRDKDGYFWLLGRADEVLKVSGHRLGTIEIEDALMGHSSIAEAAVSGRPDPIKGEGIIIFAVLKRGLSPSQDLKDGLKQQVRKVLGPIATPDEIHFVSALPKTRSGKIMRRVVKAVASGASIGDVTTLEDEASVEELKKAVEEFSKTVSG